MSCSHWNGALDPCPACACGGKVGGIKPCCWFPISPACEDCAKSLGPWAENQLDAWEADWRGRLGECTRIEWYAGDDRWQLLVHSEWKELREAAAKLRRMRGCRPGRNTFGAAAGSVPRSPRS